MGNRSEVPVVSVIMSVYNGERFLKEAIESILQQSFQDFEFLIMDDGATDSTPHILAHFAQQDQRIRLFHQQNRGLTASLNTLIRKTRARYIARMDADDISLPERLKSEVEYLDKNPDVGLVATGKWNIDAEGHVIDGLCLPDDSSRLKKWLRSGHNPFPHGSVMFRKEVIENLEGPYRFTYGQDIDLWLRLSGRTEFGMVTKPLYLQRRHKDTISAKVKDVRSLQWNTQQGLYKGKENEAEGWQELDHKLKSKPVIPEDIREAQEKYIIGKALLGNGHLASGRRVLLGNLSNKRYALKAVFLITFSFLPRQLCRHLIIALGKRNDLWAEYRLPPPVPD